MYVRPYVHLFVPTCNTHVCLWTRNPPYLPTDFLPIQLQQLLSYVREKFTVDHAEGCLLYIQEIILQHVSAEMFHRKVVRTSKYTKKNCRTVRCSNLNGISFLQLIIYIEEPLG